MMDGTSLGQQVWDILRNDELIVECMMRQSVGGLSKHCIYGDIGNLSICAIKATQQSVYCLCAI